MPNWFQEFTDFFEGQGRFVSRKEYVGLAASEVEELFEQYFDTLPSHEKTGCINVLVDGALGRSEELRQYMHDCLSLLCNLSTPDRIPWIKPHRPALEDEIRDEQNVARWVAIEDGKNEDPIESDTKWNRHYPQILLVTLWRLGSDVASRQSLALFEQASSKRFRRALKRASEHFSQRTM